MNAGNFQRSTATAPLVDPPPAEPGTEPVPDPGAPGTDPGAPGTDPPPEPSGPGTMPPDPFEPFPDDPSTPHPPDPEPDPGGLPPSRPPIQLP